jgi:hypothetical protein
MSLMQMVLQDELELLVERTNRYRRRGRRSHRKYR